MVPHTTEDTWTVVPNAPLDKIIVYAAFPSSNWLLRKVRFCPALS